MCVEPVGLFRAIRGRTGKPAVFGTSGLPEDLAPTIRDLETMDLPAFVSPDRTAAAVWALVEDAKAAFRKQRSTAALDAGPDGVDTIRETPDEAQAKAILSAIGIAVPKRAVCADHAAAKAAFADLKKPCVVKVLSAAVSHKTEMGGVHLNIQTEDQLTAALAKIDAIDVPAGKQYLIEEMAPPGLEIIVGGKNDPSFGPVVMLGLGGTAAEALGDVAMRVAPLTVDDGLDMIAELKTSALFDAWRGGPRYDKQAVAETLVKVGNLLARHPEIKEMDLNPVRVYPEGVLALDALIVS
jgi:acyl-CoA synthetase (NDP forming)